MSIVLGLRHEGKVWLACDSVGAIDEITAIRKEPKIFWNQEFLIGFVGSFKFGQVVKFCDLPSVPKNLPPKNSAGREDELERFFVKEFAPAIKQALDDSDISDEEIQQSSLLVGYQDSLYTVESNMQVGSYVHDYVAIGVAEQAGLVGMAVAGAVVEEPQSRLLYVLESIEKHSIYIKQPWNILHT